MYSAVESQQHNVVMYKARTYAASPLASTSSYHNYNTANVAYSSRLYLHTYSNHAAYNLLTFFLLIIYQ